MDRQERKKEGGVIVSTTWQKPARLFIKC